MSKKLYVGNIAPDSKEPELWKLFAQAGSVENIRIMTNRRTGVSKGFGFVEMNDGGDKAIAEFNGKDINGRQLTVTEAPQSLVLVLPTRTVGSEIP